MAGKLEVQLYIRCKFEAIQFQPNSDGHIFLLQLDEIESLADKAGLSIVEKRLFSNPITNGHLKSRIFLKLLSRKWIDFFEKATRHLPLPWQKKINTNIAVLLTPD